MNSYSSITVEEGASLSSQTEIYHRSLSNLEKIMVCIGLVFSLNSSIFLKDNPLTRPNAFSHVRLHSRYFANS